MTNPERPLVSIGLSTFNRADGFLPEALESALAQTYPNVEIIVSDNASTDGTKTVVEGYRDSRIRYFRQDANIGANANFNYCLQQARGAWFLLLHDDDLVDPDFVETCIDAAGDDADVGVIRSGTRVIDGNGALIGERPNRAGGLSTTEFFLSWFDGQTALYLCSTLFHTERLKALGGFHSKKDLLQDALAHMELAARYGRVDVEDVKASFRRHGSNRGTAERIGDWCEDSVQLLERMRELAHERPDDVWQRGQAFMSQQNYTRLARSEWRDWRAFWAIYRTFGRRYSPLRFLVEHGVIHPARKLLRKAKHATLA